MSRCHKIRDLRPRENVVATLRELAEEVVVVTCTVKLGGGVVAYYPKSIMI